MFGSRATFWIDTGEPLINQIIGLAHLKIYQNNLKTFGYTRTILHAVNKTK